MQIWEEKKKMICELCGTVMIYEGHQVGFFSCDECGYQYTCGSDDEFREYIRNKIVTLEYEKIITPKPKKKIKISPTKYNIPKTKNMFLKEYSNYTKIKKKFKKTDWLNLTK